MGINSGIYKFLTVLHVLAAIIGFGSVILNGIYGQQAKTKKGPEGLAIMQANFLVARIAELFIYAVFIFGVLLVLVSDDAVSFGDTWIWTSMTLYIVALGLSHGLLLPSVRRMIGLMEQLVAMGPPPGGRDRHGTSAAGRGDGGTRPGGRHDERCAESHPRRDPVPHDLEAVGRRREPLA